MTPEGIILENMFTIADKEGNDIPFKLNSTQRKLDENLTGRDLVPKARQEGISSYCLGRGTVKCLTKRNTKAVVISHEAKATERMLAKVHYMLDKLEPKPVIGHSSKNTITFPKMDSMFYIGTAGSSEFGRGDTINYLHCSEIAFWEDAKKLMTGLMQALVRNGEAILESTGNGQGNYYHNRIMSAVNGRSHYKIHFFDWLSFAEYNLKVSDEEADAIMSSLDADLEEIELVEKWGLTAGQIKFRREKLDELDYDLRKFDQEYPKTLDECFQATGSGIFSKVNYSPEYAWQQAHDDRHLHILSPHPQPGSKYILGGDVGAGIGKDDSTMQILELGSLEQVGEYKNNNIAPDDFGDKVLQIGEYFNHAFLTVEANNYGITTLDHMTDLNAEGQYSYPIELIYAEERSQPIGANEIQQLVNYGFRTTSKSKPFIIGKLRKYLAKYIKIHSLDLKAQLSTFIEKDNGSLEAEDGCKDDLVMALAMCCVALFKAPQLLTAYEDARKVRKLDNNQFSLGNIIKELTNKSQKGRIRSTQSQVTLEFIRR